MTIPNNFELANDSEFRLLANFTTPPRAGRITVIEPSGQVRVATDDPDGGDVLAWPLNGFTYAVDDVVYIAFAANSPDTAIVIGAKAPLPTLEPAVYSHNHDSTYVKQDGTTTLDADWDIGEDRRILAEAFRARDGEGLLLEDDSGLAGLTILDGGAIETLRTSSATRGELFIDPATRTISLGRLSPTSGHNSILEFVNRNGSEYLRIDPSNALFRFAAVIGGNVKIGAGTAAGKFHVHDGTGGLLFVSKTAISNVAQTIIADGTGDVTGGITGFFVVNDGGGAVANAFTMLPGDTLDIVVGGYTMRLALNVNGALTAVRQSGVGTATLVLLAVWM